MSMHEPFNPAELLQRRASATRLAWFIGAVVLAIYLIGFFFKRG